MMLGKVFLKRCAWRLDVAVPSSRTAVGIFYRMKIVVECFLEGMDGIVQCIEDVAFWSHLTWLEITTGQFFALLPMDFRANHGSLQDGKMRVS